MRGQFGNQFRFAHTSAADAENEWIFEKNKSCKRFISFFEKKGEKKPEIQNWSH